VPTIARAATAAASKYRFRFPYLLGVLVDAIAAFALLTPAGSPIRTLAYPGVDASQVAFADGSRTAFALMLGWTILLAWGARQPIERRLVLLFTAFPVVVGLMATEVLDIANGYASASGTLSTLGLQTVLVAIFLGSYWAARRAAPGLAGLDVDPRAQDRLSGNSFESSHQAFAALERDPGRRTALGPSSGPIQALGA
jgi:hypothetical protein